MTFTRSGTIIDVLSNEQFSGTVHVIDDRIDKIVREDVTSTCCILPGFVDAHVHIESSMLPPSEFARLAVVHGTVATVSDPHEIANVLGMRGMDYMLQNASRVPLKINFGAPSCVPATSFETAGAVLSADDIRTLCLDPRIKYLSEMMNYPGVLHSDAVVMQKIAVAKEFNRPIDGHAPGLRGDDARRYIAAGISTDHECFTLDEALDKLQWGMKILIREGSAARNFEALHSLITSHTGMVMLCSDDKHPDSLEAGHINLVVKRALDKGHDLMNVLRAACVNPVRHYGLDVGLLQPGDAADFIVIDSLNNFNILETFINGECVARNGVSLLQHLRSEPINNFTCSAIEVGSLKIPAGSSTIRVIEARDTQLITNEVILESKIIDDYYASDTTRDILKIVVVNRYANAKPAVGFIRNFGFKRGAIASSVAHDSHNIVAVGASDEEICRAVNAIIDAWGGVCVVENENVEILQLDIAGLMSSRDGYEVARTYARLDNRARDFGSTLTSPFMTLSFMALLVIPKLKMSDLGLFDGGRFEFVEVAVRLRSP